MAKSKTLEVDRILTILQEGPSRIAEAAANVPANLLHVPPGADTWSANDVLAHLRACADIWGGCIEAILAEDSPTIRAVNPRTWIESTDYVEQNFRKSLQAFRGQRDNLLSLLHSLPSDDWSRRATITGAGKPLVRTVHDYADWLAVHERPHVKQIQRTVLAVTKG